MTITRIAHGVESNTGALVVIVLALGVGIFTTRSDRADARVIERIEIHGNTRTRDKVIRRVLDMHEGSTLEHGCLDRARRRVESLGYFARVAVRVRSGSSAELVRVDIDVTQRPEAAGGAGFSSTENFIATCTMEQH